MIDNLLSDPVDKDIFRCLNPEDPKSFFLFAGAGSGKTRSLVNVLHAFRKTHLKLLQRKSKKVAVITYTNAACEEIKERLDFDDSFHISTIHSFAWDIIKPFTKDIKDWLINNIQQEQKTIEEKLKKGRSGTKAEIGRKKKIELNNKRLENLLTIKAFIYSPNGLSNEKESLNHAEVIKITASLLSEKPLLQKILVRKFPILLIDETQDTQKDLIDVFIKTQITHKNIFCLGLLGDLMQRIYSDGKEKLNEDIPKDWLTPEKIINYRCPTRVVELINHIRKDVDNHQQTPNKKNEGIIRLFVVDSNKQPNKLELEQNIAERMSMICNDPDWTDLRKQVKSLILEHHMAASRLGFSNFFMTLYDNLKNKSGISDGSLDSISFLTTILLPFIDAINNDQHFLITQLVKKYSNFLKLTNGNDITNQLKKYQESVDLLKNIKNQDPDLLSILNIVGNIFPLPDIFLQVLAAKNTIENEIESTEKNEINVWTKALSSPFKQLKAYAQYVFNESNFGTHQGVKGLQFPRVMVILDDEESRGFLFKYEELLGASNKSSTYITDGETTIDRSRRLFYVTCSRSEESLAVVVYTKQPNQVKRFAISQQWFKENEIISI